MKIILVGDSGIIGKRIHDRFAQKNWAKALKSGLM